MGHGHDMDLDARVAAAARTATEAFWTALAAGLPEIASGDLPPDAAHQFDLAAARAAAEWASYNRLDLAADDGITRCPDCERPCHASESGDNGLCDVCLASRIERWFDNDPEVDATATVEPDGIRVTFTRVWPTVMNNGVAIRRADGQWDFSGLASLADYIADVIADCEVAQ